MEEKVAINSYIARKQEDWETLIKNKSCEDYIAPEDEGLFREQFLAARGMPQEERGIIGNMWFHDAVHGRRMEMPQSSMALNSLLFLRSTQVKLFISTVMLLQIGAIFFEQPGCDDASYYDSYDFFENKHISRFALTIFDMMCAVLYTTDIVVAFVADPWKKKYVKKDAEFISRMWILVRLFCSIIIMIDCSRYFSLQAHGKISMRFSRVVFPIIFLSRRENLKQMVQGMLFSAYNSLFVQGVLFVVIVMWGASGFFLFHNIKYVDGDKFRNFLLSILTALHCYSSRPTVLYVLNPFFNHNIHGTAFWAVSLSIVADIMVTSLIIAMGKRYYRDFGVGFFRTRLSYRRDAVVGIFTLYCNRESDGGELSQISTAKIKRRKSVSSASFSSLISRTVSNNGSVHEHDQLESGTITFAAWLELCSCIEGKYALSRSTASLLFCLEDKTNSGKVGLVQFAKLLAIVASRVRVVAETSGPETIGAESIEGAEPVGAVPTDNVGTPTEPNKRTTGTLKFSLKGKPKQDNFRLTESRLLEDLIELDSDDEDDAVILQQEYLEDDRYSQPHQGSDFELQFRGDSAISFANANLTRASNTEGILKEIGDEHRQRNTMAAKDRVPMNVRDSLFVMFPMFSRWAGRDPEAIAEYKHRQIELKVRLRTSMEKVVFVGMFHSWKLDELVAVTFHVILCCQLLYVSRKHTNSVTAWLTVGWFLEIYFIFDMFLHIFVYGKKRIAAFCSMVVNGISFVAMCILGHQMNETILVLLLATQASRLLRVFEFVKRKQIFRSMIPTMTRALFIVMCMIYSFACFGHMSFCTRLSVDNVDTTDDPYSDDATDDAANWVSYSNLLNFNSYLQSYYTMYAVSTASNWSMVMDAAADTDPTFALIFFYGYRLLMALFVLPIFFGFIIQCYIQCYDLEYTASHGQQSPPAGRVASIDRKSVPIKIESGSGNLVNEFSYHREESTESQSSGWSFGESLSEHETNSTSGEPEGHEPKRSSRNLTGSNRNSHDSIGRTHNIIGQKKETTMIALWSADRRERLVENPDEPVHKITAAAGLLRQTMLKLSEQRKRTVAMHKCVVDKLQKTKHSVAASDYSNNPLLKQASLAFVAENSLPEFRVQQFQVCDCRLTHTQTEWSKICRNPEYTALPSAVVWFKSWMGYTETRIDNILRRMSDDLTEPEPVCPPHPLSVEPTMSKANLLYDDESNTLQTTWPCSLAGKLKPERIAKLASLMFSDAVHARAVEFPANDYQLRCYQFVRSPYVKWGLLALLFLQMAGPLIEVPYCAYGGAKMVTSTSMLYEGRPTRLLLSILDMCYTSFFVYEALMQLSIDRRARVISVKLHEYVGLQLFIYMCIYVDCIGFFCDFQNPRYSRMLFPLILLSRDNNLRQMLRGLSRSVSESVQLYRIIIVVLLIWGFFGCLCFRRITAYPHFLDPFRAVFTCLHIFTSSPYALLVLNQYFGVEGTSGVSPLYFTILTVVAELLLASLVIATGTMQFKVFSKWNLARRLGLRKNACSAAFHLLIQTQELSEGDQISSGDNSKLLTRDSWRRFCSSWSKGKYQIDSYSVDDLFSYVAAGELDTRKDIDSVSEKDTTPTTGSTNIDSILEDSEEVCVTEKGFFRLCALLSCRAHSNRQLVAEALAYQEEQSAKFDDSRASSITAIHTTMANAFAPNLLGEDGEGRLYDDSQLLWRTNRIFILNFDYDEDEFRRSLVTMLPSWMTMRSGLREYIAEWVPKYTTMMVYYSRVAVTYTYTTPFTTQAYTHFETIANMALVLLFVQLMLLTSHSIASGRNIWYILLFGYALECVFVVEMCIRISAMGLRNYLNTTSYFLECLINFLSLLFMLLFSGDVDDRTSTVFFCLVTLQCMRFQRLLWYVPGAAAFKAIRPVVARVIYVFFAVIYAFAIIAHVLFCAHLSTTSVDDQEDDDSSSWVQFANQLNFSTYLNSMYTLFEMTILGNWSIVMDAAAKTNHAIGSYLFFYTFRLLMTMVFLPLLMSFVIQSFITANDMRSNHKDIHQKVKGLTLKLSPAELNESYREKSSVAAVVGSGVNDAADGAALDLGKEREFFTPFMETLEDVRVEEGDTTANLKESSSFLPLNTFMSLWSPDLGILGGCPRYLLEIDTQQLNAEEELLCHDRYLLELNKYMAASQ